MNPKLSPNSHLNLFLCIKDISAIIFSVLSLHKYSWIICVYISDKNFNVVAR